MSQDPSSFHLTFLDIQLLPFVGVTEQGPPGAARIPRGCLGNSWPTVFITKGGNLGSFDPDFKESQLFVNYESWKCSHEPQMLKPGAVVWETSALRVSGAVSSPSLPWGC